MMYIVSIAEVRVVTETYVSQLLRNDDVA